MFPVVTLNASLSAAANFSLIVSAMVSPKNQFVHYINIVLLSFLHFNYLFI